MMQKSGKDRAGENSREVVDATSNRRVVLVVSQFGFMPGNYNRFVREMLKSPQVIGVIEVNDSGKQLLTWALSLVFHRLGWRLGLRIIGNFWRSLWSQRQRIVQSHQKQFAQFANINRPACLQWLREQKVDLVIHSRTRQRFGAEVLSLPRFGCWNIHHGLLPQQKGVFCEFWALRQKEDLGFTIHQMNQGIDAGAIIAQVKYQGPKNDFQKILLAITELEISQCRELMGIMNLSPQALPHASQTESTNKHWKLPRARDFQSLVDAHIKI